MRVGWVDLPDVWMTRGMLCVCKERMKSELECNGIELTVFPVWHFILSTPGSM